MTSTVGSAATTSANASIQTVGKVVSVVPGVRPLQSAAENRPDEKYLNSIADAEARNTRGRASSFPPTANLRALHVPDLPVPIRGKSHRSRPSQRMFPFHPFVARSKPRPPRSCLQQAGGNTPFLFEHRDSTLQFKGQSPLQTGFHARSA
ncbi:MAG: hypothetical protein U1D30_12295 [Planctomycetota bacterium]